MVAQQNEYVTEIEELKKTCLRKLHMATRRVILHGQVNDHLN